ncbi:hypothetical protein GCM10010532_091640 [Dactylosporangium siamense]
MPALWLTIASLVVSSCGLVIPWKTVSIGDVAWQSDTVLLYVARLDGANEVRSVRSDRRPVSGDPAIPGLRSVCEPVDYGLRPLAGGKVAVSVLCSGGAGTELFEYDGQAVGWGDTQAGHVIGQWDGVGGYGVLIGFHCTGLVQLGAKVGAALTVPTGVGPVRVDEPRASCAFDQMNAGWPMPHGRGVDFLVALESAGLQDDLRRRSPWTLFRVEGGQSAAAVRDGFVDVRGAASSGDGGTVVIAAERDGLRALWAVDMPGGGVRKLADGFFGAVSFAPDGKRFAAVLLGGAKNDEIRVLTLK